MSDRYNMNNSCVAALYASSLAGNLVEQLWNFAWPSSIALLHPSLLPVAVMGFFSKVVILQYLNWIPLFVASGMLSNKQCVKQLAIIIGGPLLGKLMDYSPRVPAYMGLNVVQVIFLTSYILAGYKLSLAVLFFILLFLSGSCTVVICYNDNSCTYCFFYFCTSCSFPSMVYCTCVSGGYREAMWSSHRGCCGA